VNLDRLRALDAVATHGSVNGAAAALHLTSSAVSQQLGKLEREVGQRLLERDGRGVRLTEAATLLAEHAARILAQVEAARSDLEAHRGELRGHVTLAAFASAARGIAPGALRLLGERYPDLVTELREREIDESIPLTVRGEVEVALVHDWDVEPLVLPPALDRELVTQDAFDLLLPSDHPLARRTSVHLRDLAGEPMIGWTKDSFSYRWLVHTMRAEGVEPLIPHTAEEHPTQLALVAAGLGLAILPRIGRTVLDEGIAVVPLRPRLARHIYAVWRADAGARPAIRAVRAALRTAARNP
jgi:DNA-binding transcriptional LysR family regulator